MKRAILFLLGIPYWIRTNSKYAMLWLKNGPPNKEYRGPGNEGNYDVFISYRSEDTENVRLIAEALMANGVRPWFAEYKINLFNRPHFKEEIEAAIGSSRHFVFFATRSYYQSEYCLDELRQAKENPSLWPGCALEIRHIKNDDTLPKSGDGIPVFGTPYTFTYQSELRKTVEAIADQIGRNLRVPESEITIGVLDSATTEVHGPQRKTIFTTLGWQILKEGQSNKLILTQTALVKKTKAGRIACKITQRQIGYPENFRYQTEREKIDRFIELMRDRAKRMHHEIIGVHHIKLFGKAHPAFTIKHKNEDVYRRLYAIFSDTTRYGEDIYIELHFSFHGEERGFYSVARHMDDLVYSARREKIIYRKAKLGRTTKAKRHNRC